jgi:hypothetical protein
MHQDEHIEISDTHGWTERRQSLTVEKIVHKVIDIIRAEMLFMSHDEHEFLRTLIHREQIRAERWEKIKTQVLGWGIIAVAGWLGTVVWDNVIRAAKG